MVPNLSCPRPTPPKRRLDCRYECEDDSDEYTHRREGMNGWIGIGTRFNFPKSLRDTFWQGGPVVHGWISAQRQWKPLAALASHTLVPVTAACFFALHTHTQTHTLCVHIRKTWARCCSSASTSRLGGRKIQGKRSFAASAHFPSVSSASYARRYGMASQRDLLSLFLFSANASFSLCMRLCGMRIGLKVSLR